MAKRLRGEDIRYGPNGEFAQFISASIDPETNMLNVKFGSVEELKKQGNEFYKKKDYENAKRSYTSALDELIPVKNGVAADKDGWIFYESTEAKLLNNRGMCYLKLKQYDRAIRDLTNCINICTVDRQPEQPITHFGWNRQLVKVRAKALYRRAQALEAIGNFSKALSDACQSTDDNAGYKTPEQRAMIKRLAASADHVPRNLDLSSLNTKNRVVVNGAQWKKLRIQNQGPEPTSHGFRCVHYKGKLYMLGGENENIGGCVDSFWSFDLQTLTWERLQSRIRGRKHHSMVVYNDAMFVLGGVDDEASSYQDKLWKYDFQKKAWSAVKSKGPFPKSLSQHSALVYEGRMYVFGGEVEYDQCNTLWEFNFSTSRWRKLCGGKKRFQLDMPEIRSCPAFWASEGKLWVYGGVYYRPDNMIMQDYATFDCWTFDLNTHKWSEELQFGNIPSSRTEFAYCTMNESSCFIFGGYSQTLGSSANAINMQSFSYFNEAFIFSSKYSTWRMLHPKDWKLPPLNAGGQCVMVEEKIYAIPGYINSILDFERHRCFFLRYFGGTGLTIFEDIWVLDLSNANTSECFRKCANCHRSSQEVRINQCAGTCGGKVSYCSVDCQKEHVTSINSKLNHGYFKIISNIYTASTKK